MNLSDYTGNPCTSRIAYTFLPKRGKNLDMRKSAKGLRGNGVFVELETDYLLMLKLLGTDVSLFRSGKIIVKNTNDKKEASKIAGKLLGKMN